MSKWNELPAKVQLGIVLAVAVAITVALYFLTFKAIADQNRADMETLTVKRAEVDQLRPYQNKLAELNRSVESLKQQLELQKRIVPDEKQTEGFLHLMQGAASAAGIEIRRYSAKPPSAKEFYTEVPFELEIDGPYYSVLSFFEKVGQLERIVNISGLQMASVKVPNAAKAKRTYQYAPGESVVATCMATTFFSHDPQTTQPAAPKPAAPAK